ncbi:MAG TPA: Ig-like domain-containing protein [Candidatus Angelobacter sp.]|nr:Ig-like domain-containing protein [Candidatus Angelobacter sp.]
MMKIARKSWFLCAAAICCAAASAFAGVTVSSPASGSTTNSPVHFVASASAGLPIAAMMVYVDGNGLYKTSGAHLDTNLNMGTGAHSVIVQAWDTKGNVVKNAFGLNVGSSSTGSTPSGSGGAVRSLIETMPGWESCTVCAGVNAHGPVAAYGSQQNVKSPSLNGRSMQFNIGGKTPYADAIWWKQLGASNSATHFQYDLDFYITAPQFAEALEFDVNQSIGSRKFIFGTECNIKGGGVWDVWDTANATWRHTGVGCSAPAAYKWHHLTWEFYRDNAATHFVAVTLDGVKHYVNYTYYSRAVSANEINVAFQMDGDYAQHPYAAWLNNVTLRYW